MHGCHGYLNAYRIGKDFHVQAVVYNQASGETSVHCGGYLLRKHGRGGQWLKYGRNGDPTTELAAYWRQDGDATGFYKDPTNWWAKACVYACLNDSETPTATHCGPAS
ncbi:hypothetical protein [Streptomyces auratus]|uniref:Uncharacterized protein n=1 Tax=Streptomyces auratus AGR0001 TaxID=1160718 RepID=J2JPZ3_9ACTN|nr:hypothetical protein [Streptomyces auratus]QTZ90044.1 hypothetical protein SU9_000045 [Streptomyces auratus AGR0001]